MLRSAAARIQAPSCCGRAAGPFRMRREPPVKSPAARFWCCLAVRLVPVAAQVEPIAEQPALVAAKPMLAAAKPILAAAEPILAAAKPIRARPRPASRWRQRRLQVPRTIAACLRQAVADHHRAMALPRPAGGMPLAAVSPAGYWRRADSPAAVQRGAKAFRWADAGLQAPAAPGAMTQQLRLFPGSGHLSRQKGRCSAGLWSVEGRPASRLPEVLRRLARVSALKRAQVRVAPHAKSAGRGGSPDWKLPVSAGSGRAGPGLMRATQAVRTRPPAAARLSAPPLRHDRRQRLRPALRGLQSLAREQSRQPATPWWPAPRQARPAGSATAQAEPEPATPAAPGRATAPVPCRWPRPGQPSPALPPAPPPAAGPRRAAPQSPALPRRWAVRAARRAGWRGSAARQS